MKLLGTRRRRLTLALVMAIGGFLASPLLLAALKQFLLVDELHQTATWVSPVDGNDAWRAAARMVERGSARGVLIFTARSERVVRYGILPARHEVGRQVVLRQGIAPERIRVIDGQIGNWYQLIQQYRAWLDQHPQDTIAITCSRTGGRAIRKAFDALLPAEQARRLLVVSLPDPQFDESRWWPGRYEMKALFHGLLQWLAPAGLIYDQPVREWDFDAYRQELHDKR